MAVQHPSLDGAVADLPQDGPTTLWTMRKNGRRLSAEVLRHHDRWELRLSAEDVMFTWRRFAQRASAVAYADLIQQDLELDHWY